MFSFGTSVFPNPIPSSAGEADEEYRTFVRYRKEEDLFNTNWLKLSNKILTPAIGIHLNSHANMVIPRNGIKPYKASVDHRRQGVTDDSILIWITSESLTIKVTLIIYDVNSIYRLLELY